MAQSDSRNSHYRQAEALLTKLREAGERRGIAKRAWTLLDLERHVVLAHCMRSAEAAGATSVAAQDREARCDPAYREHIEALAQATHELDLATAHYEERRLACELWRTIQARERAELETYRSDTHP